MLVLLSLIGQLADPMPAIGLTLEVGQEFEIALPCRGEEMWTSHDFDRKVARQERLPTISAWRQSCPFVARGPGKTTIRLICGRGSEPRVRIVEVSIEVKEKP